MSLDTVMDKKQPPQEYAIDPILLVALAALAAILGEIAIKMLNL
jgi:hypothetical protein